MQINATDLGTLVITQPNCDLPAIRLFLGVGAQGPQGEQGLNGEGVPPSGSTGQFLAKASSADYDTQWVNVNVSGYLPLTGGTMSGAIGFDSVGTQNIAKGSFDSGRGGYNGVSLNCAVGYELNWQAGWLKAVDQAGNKVTINSDSALNIEYGGSRVIVDTTAVYTTRFDGGTNPNAYGAIYNGGVEVGDSNGLWAELTPTQLRFGDGTVQTTASTGILGSNIYIDDDSNLQTQITIANEETKCEIELRGLSTNNWVKLSTDNDSEQKLIFSTGMKVGLTGITFPDSSQQTTAAVTPDLSGYLTSATASSTYQTISGMSSYLTTATASSTYFPKPTGTTSQYIDGTGGLVTFPTVGTAGKMTMTAYNQTGASIPQGSVVYISGAHGNDPQVSLAKADSEATSAFTIAVAQSAVPNNSNGTFITTGLLEGFATNGFGADGTPLYLSPTVAGGLTATKPFAPYHYVRVGTVVRSHPTQGTVFISITNGFQLDEMSDVASTAPLNNNVLTFESSSGMWKDKSVSTALGYAPANQTLSNITSQSTARTSLGLGSMAVETASNYLTTSSAASTYTTKANNLSDLASASTSRTNLGLSYATDAQVIAGTSASTVMTPAQSQFGMQNWVVPTTLSTAVSTGTVTSTGYGSRCQLTATASGQYAIVYPSNSSIATFTNSGADYANSNFSKRIKIYGRVYCSMTANLNAYYAWGRSNNTPSTIGSPAVKGFGIRIQGTGAVELQVHNGTTLTNVTSSFTPTNLQVFDCLIDSIGDGNVNLYINGALAATSSAGPTGTQAGFPLLIQELSSTGSSTVGNFYVTGKSLYFA